MPNQANVVRPAILVGAGRTSSSYVQDRLRHGLGRFYSTIENDLYRDVHEVMTNAGWSFRYKYVGDPDTVAKRVTQAMRDMFATVFASDLPEWSMKCIWDKHDVSVLDRLFPEARYIHLVRDPRTNIPSMMERLDYTKKYAFEMYVQSNRNALEFSQFADRYLLIRQEDFVDSREATWQRVCEFLSETYLPGVWDRELNASKSTEGKIDTKRDHDRLTWAKLPKDVREMAEKIGYSE